MIEMLGGWPGPNDQVDYVALEAVSDKGQKQIATDLFENTVVDDNGVAICNDPISGDRTRLAVARIGSEVVQVPLLADQSEEKPLKLPVPHGSTPRVIIFVGNEPAEDDRTPEGFSRSVVIRASAGPVHDLPAAVALNRYPHDDGRMLFHNREIPYCLTDGDEKRNTDENRYAGAIGLFDKLGFSRHTRGIGQLTTIDLVEGTRRDLDIKAGLGLDLEVGVFLTKERIDKVPQARALHAAFPITVVGV